MQLTWLGAAGFRIKTPEGAIFLIDPFLSRPPEATPVSPIRLPDLFPVDEIFLTHGRFDHALDSPAIVEQTGAIVHGPPDVTTHLAALGVSPHSLQPVKLNQTNWLGSLTWQALAGRIREGDFSPALQALIRNRVAFSQTRTLDRDWPLGEVVVYLFQTDSLSLIHFGSAGWDEATLPTVRPDVALLPVERPVTAEAAAVKLALRLRPRLLIPHHWDNYHPAISQTPDLTNLAGLIQSQEPSIRVYLPEIGQPFEITVLLE